MSSISNIINAFGDPGPAKANRFRVEFTLPAGASSQSSEVWINTNSTSGQMRSLNSEINGNNRMSIMCHTATLPSREIQSFEVKQWGPPFRMPHTAAYMPVSFAFYSDSTLSSREFFDSWQCAVTNIGSNSFNFLNEYIADIKIVTLDMEGRDQYYVELFDCWPTSVSQLDYSYGNNDALQSVMVVMSYRVWRSKENDTRVRLF